MLSIFSYYGPFTLLLFFLYCFYDGVQLVILSWRAKTYSGDRTKTRVDKNRIKVSSSKTNVSENEVEVTVFFFYEKEKSKTDYLRKGKAHIVNPQNVNLMKL